ncbi:BREX-1 system adenine-specific DNA-methyltransferase PglX [Collinsella sp. An268]|uniref:BREX-1 system adenine-specific DNA-methyltransferase PglX n=1 Tax=Collinsella sp. An268 TaxID=1965612 RepID=UPI000B36ADE3|nr:BREX-1 system adenine-specific DNA-methyltransferase PglX [Collinsella sp. An268]OUO64673.1 hypothetical protein B5F70_03255 [Collinsella sp. An268]
MDTKALEKFCPWARNKLIGAVKDRCALYGLTDAGRAAAPRSSRVFNGRVLSDEEMRQRDNLMTRIEEMGFEAFVEQVAYSWFNRFAGIRYMELRGYLPSRVRMLSAADGSFDPECLRAAGELDLPGLDRDRALDLAARGKDDALFPLILIAQCDQLAEALPAVFDHVDDADALLLPDGLLNRDENSVLYHLVTDIPEKTMKRVEALGWMYQFYNSELKRDYLDSGRKAAAEDIAPATQLFTPDWIVRYMVDNSLGRLWMLNFPESRLIERANAEDPDERLMEHYIQPDKEHEDFIHITGPEDIAFCDPACGSGHILVYAFKMLAAMYEERGYPAREIPQLILTRNLSGMEIDPRAAQIAQLALAMCAREMDRRFLERSVVADVRVLESVTFDEDELPETSLLVQHKKGDLLESLAHLSEIGSLLTVDEEGLACVRGDAETCTRAAEHDLLLTGAAKKLAKARAACETLSRRFDVVVANPPYMGSSRFNPFMSKWMKKRYPNVKSDLFAAFIVRTMDYADDHGEVGIMSPFVWMFIGSYEKLRNKIIDEKTLTSLIQLEYSGFASATVPICTFTFHNTHIDGYMGGYIRLSDFVGASVQAPKALEAIQNPDCGYFYRADATTFHDIPGSPIAYWASKAVHKAFLDNPRLGDLADLKMGLSTGDNDKFYRRWWEVADNRITRGCKSFEQAGNESEKWFPCNRGGKYRKWWGNITSVIDWQNHGEGILTFRKNGRLASRPQNLTWSFKPGCSWNLITSGETSMRLIPSGMMFDQAGCMAFPKESRITSAELLSLINSSVGNYFLKLINPTLNCSPGIMNLVPINLSADSTDINELELEAIALSRNDWNSQEISWDFKRNPLL